MTQTQILAKAKGTFTCGSVNPEIAPFLAIITDTQESGCKQELTGVIKKPAKT